MDGIIRRNTRSNDQNEDLKELMIENKINDQNSFFESFKTNENLENLSFRGSSLGQTFYDKIIQLFPFIKKLVIVDELEILDNLNFGFLFRHQYLEQFITNKYLSYEFIENLFNKLNHFKSVKFKKGRSKIDVNLVNDQIMVLINRTSMYSLETYKNLEY